MKSRFTVAIVLLALMTALAAFAQNDAADRATNAFDKARAKAYGDVGTNEIGFGGMGGIGSMTDLTNTVPTDAVPSKVYNGNFSIFEKYFVAKHVHVGYAALGNFSLQYNDKNKIIGGNGNATFIGQVGYAIPVSPSMQFDATGGLGGAAVFLTWDPIWALVYSGQGMFLFPVGENANIGVGGIVLGMDIKGKVYDESINLRSITTNAIIQISVYF